MHFARKIIGFLLIACMIFSLIPSFSVEVLAISTDSFDANTYAADLLTDQRVSPLGIEYQHVFKDLLDYYIDSHRSYADYFVSDLDNSSFRAAVAAWEIYTFHAADSADKVIEAQNRYVEYILAMINGTISSEEYTASKINDLADKVNSGSSDIVDLLDLASSTDIDVKLLKDPQNLKKLSDSFGSNKYLKATGDATSVISNIIDASKTVTDFVKRISTFEQTCEISEEVYRCLLTMKEITSDSFLRSALDEVCTYFKDAEGRIQTLALEASVSAASAAVRLGSTTVIDGVLEIVKASNPVVYAVIEAIQVGRAIGKLISDTFFGTSDNVEMFYNLGALVKIERLTAELIKSKEWSYRNNPSKENADDYMTSIDLYCVMQLLSIDYSKTAIAELYEGGVFSSFRDMNNKDSIINTIEGGRPGVSGFYEKMKNFWRVSAKKEYPDLFNDEETIDDTPVITDITWFHVTGPSGIDMFVGDSKQINESSIVFTPENAPKGYTLTSDNEEVISISEHTLTAKSAGTARVRVISSDNPKIYDERLLVVGEKKELSSDDCLDLVFVIDTTGSMGNDIAQVKRNMEKYLEMLKNQKMSFKIAIVDYRDFPERTGASEDYPYNIHLDFTDDEKIIIDSIHSLNLGDGGDFEETLYSALIDGLKELSWRNNSGKAVVVMGDAPALDPEPNTGYTAKTVAIALDGITYSSGYTPESGSGPALIRSKRNAVSESAKEITPLFPGEKIMLNVIATKNRASNSFNELSNVAGGFSYSSSESSVDEVVSHIIEEAPAIVLHTHEYTETIVTATCEKPIERIKTCIICGEKTVEQTEEVPGHNFGDWILIKRATATEEGIEQRTCSLCSAKEERSVPRFILGDINGDGEVDPIDRMILSRYIAKWDDYEERIVDMSAADINGDGDVDPVDRMILSRYIANWDGYAKYFK